MKMNFEELKAEAAKHGYNLIKKPENIRFKPCVCGKNRRTFWYSSRGDFYECKSCGFRGGYGKGAKAAKIAWNEAVEKEVNRNEDVD